MAIEQTLDAPSPYIRSIVRIVVALLFLEHGLSRLFGWPSALPTPPALTLYWFAGAIELCGGLLFGLGLFTRPVAFLMSGEMAAAYFLSHAPRNFFPILNGGDAAILYSSSSCISPSPVRGRGAWMRCGGSGFNMVFVGWVERRETHAPQYAPVQTGGATGRA